jgi:hypothetical protein
MWSDEMIPAEDPSDDEASDHDVVPKNKCRLLRKTQATTKNELAAKMT